MAADGTPGAKGNPTFTDGGAPDLAVDSTLISQWSADNIDRRVANTAARNALTPKYVGMKVQVADANETIYSCTNAAGSGTWIIVGGTLAIGTLGNDASQTVFYSSLTRDPWGRVVLNATTTRTGGTTYASSLIVGILPVGFRPTQDDIGLALTYGSGTLNGFNVVASTGVMTLAAPSPAGHTAARLQATFASV